MKTCRLFKGPEVKNKMTCPMNIELPTGAKMPALGYGTWQATEEVLEPAVEAALEAGYRHFDTATAYGNEHVLGKVFKRWLDEGKVQRDELFVVTKLPPSGLRASSVEKYITKSLKALNLDYLDLYLIHVPFGFQETGDLHPVGPDGKFLIDYETDHVATWKAMEDQVDAGRTKAIGISNFNQKQIQRILDSARIPPANLQVEVHVYFQQRPLVEFCKKNNITVVGYSPLGSKGSDTFAMHKGVPRESMPCLLDNETVGEIAKKHNKAPAHVLLRHLLQRGIATIPKSVTPERIASNFQVFDFELDDEDMEALNKLDREDGRLFDLSIFNAMDHPEYPYYVSVR